MGNKYLIIGVMKGGTSSLQKYFESQGHEVIRNSQLFTRMDGIDVYKNKYQDYTPVVILRDPIDRAWADYHHRLRRDLIPGDVSYENYVFRYGENYDNYLSVGELNIIEISKYHKWLDYWGDLDNLKILYLEEMQKIPDFPQKNKGLYPKIPQDLKEMTEELLNEI